MSVLKNIEGKFFLSVLIIVLVFVCSTPVFACTSYYVGADCSADGSVLFGRTEDIGPNNDKVFKVIPAQSVGANAMYRDATGASSFTAPIQTDTTYRYTICRDCEKLGDGYYGAAGVNTAGVSVSATTSASVPERIMVFDPKTENGIAERDLPDYILCQASSARQGVKLLASVIDTIGSGCRGGIFIADQTEVWYIEILTGHNYCAVKMPTDKAAIIPNCIVIGDVDLTDTENVIASPNLVSLAKENGFWVGAVGRGDINVKLSYTGNGYAALNADRIRGGQFLLTGKDDKDIYTADYQNILFDCSGITVEKLYELAGYRYEGMDFGREITCRIDEGDSAECHIFQIRSQLPVELATIEWLCMFNANYSTFVPFYGSLLTDTAESYKMEALERNSQSAYWIFHDLAQLCAQNPQYYGTGIKSYFTAYMTNMEAMQPLVDEKMLAVYENDRSDLERQATELGYAVSEAAKNMAITLKAELDAYVAANTGYAPTTPFVSSLDPDDITYGNVKSTEVTLPVDETTDNSALLEIDAIANQTVKPAYIVCIVIVIALVGMAFLMSRKKKRSDHNRKDI